MTEQPHSVESSACICGVVVKCDGAQLVGWLIEEEEDRQKLNDENII
jgi:hypothetical protein